MNPLIKHKIFKGGYSYKNKKGESEVKRKPIIWKLFVVEIILLFIGVSIAPTSNTGVVSASPFITYAPSIIIEYDEEYLNETEFVPGGTYTLDLVVGYKVFVPAWLLDSNIYFFQLLKNWYLFRKVISPAIQITLSIDTIPTWALIQPIPSLVMIPTYSNEFVTASCQLIITLHEEAPPGAFTFFVNAQTPPVHRIGGYLYTSDITITVQ